MNVNLAHDELAMVDYARTARLLLLANDPSAGDRMQAASGRLPVRVLHATLSEGSHRLADGAGADCAVLRIGTRDEAEATPLIRGIKDGALGVSRWVIDTSPEMLDWAVAQAWTSDVLHVCDPREDEWVEALEWALARAPDRLHDGNRGASQLQQLSEEAKRIASALASLSQTEAEREHGGERPIDAARVRAIIRGRRLRDHFLGSDLFADPAWDMLLDLMAARLEGQQVAVTSLCIAAAVPPTTALRWIKALTDQGIFVRVADPQDGRRVHIALSDQVADALEAYLKAVQRVTSTLV